MRTFWAVCFFILTAISLLVASCETIRLFFGQSHANRAAAIGELLLVVVLAVGEIIAFTELRHAGTERQFEYWLKMQAIWMDPTFRDGRGKLFQRLQSRNTVWTEEEKREAKDVCRRLDEFSWLAQFVGSARMLRTWDNPLAKSWLVLEEIVNEERTISRWQEKWKGFETLGRKAVAKLISEGKDPRQPKEL